MTLINPAYYTSDLLHGILSSTNGDLFFDEQVMEILHKIAGYSFPEVEELFRLLRCKRAFPGRESEIMERLEENLKSKSDAFTLFNDISTVYSKGTKIFNKSHKVSLAYLTAKSAYLKMKYPKEYQMHHNWHAHAGCKFIFG